MHNPNTKNGWYLITIQNNTKTYTKTEQDPSTLSGCYAFFENDLLKFEGTLVNGNKADGYHITNPNAIPSLIQNVNELNDDSVHNFAEYRNNQLLRDGQIYKKQFWKSTKYEYDTNGRLTQQTPYYYNEKHGMAITWRNGQKFLERQYTYGEARGIYRRYGGSHHHLIEEGQLQHGQTEGIVKQYNDYGLLLSQLTIHNGKNVKTTVYDYHNDGHRTYLQDTIEYNYTEHNEFYTEFYANESKKAEYTIVNEKYHGDHKTYHRNGNIASQCTYNHGKKNGDAIIYNEQGQVISKITYQNGQIVAQSQNINNQTGNIKINLKNTNNEPNIGKK